MEKSYRLPNARAQDACGSGNRPGGAAMGPGAWEEGARAGGTELSQCPQPHKKGSREEATGGWRVLA